MSARLRAQYLAAGVYQTHGGALVRLHEMGDRHLVNALLRALRDGEPEGVSQPLADEVRRRGLKDLALETAAARGLARE